MDNHPEDSASPIVPAPSSKTIRYLSVIGRIIGVAAILAISYMVFTRGDQVREREELGYLGGLVVMLLGNATIILPAPGLTIVFALGSSLNPFLLGLSAGVGACLGELTGYLAGASGQAIVKNRDVYRRIKKWMDRYGLGALFVFAAIPNPFFDLAGILAGILGFKWWRFLLVCWAGKTVQGILVAMAGAASANWVLEWLN